MKIKPALTRDLISEPSDDFKWKLYEVDSEVDNAGTTAATWAQTSQQRPVFKKENQKRVKIKRKKLLLRKGEITRKIINKKNEVT